ncbi:protein-(glutamine-N5) methyltransferase, release factor-specific, partial [Escherichia coli]
MAYLLGRREFMGHLFRVTPDVLIPRPDTEVLVETALQCITGITGPAVLDLGTGSGAIAVSIALARRDARVMASDVSAAAL